MRSLPWSYLGPWFALLFAACAGESTDTSGAAGQSSASSGAGGTTTASTVGAATAMGGVGAQSNLGGAMPTAGGNATSSSAGGTSNPGANGGSGGLASGLSNCDASKVTCKIAVPDCSTQGANLVAPSSFGFVPEVNASGACYTGRCVAIEQCSCASAADCPDSNSYTCWTSAHHCGPYVQ